MRVPTFLILLMMTHATFAQSVPPPPSTPAKPVTENIHGTSITDPYRWLEGDAGGKVTDEVAKWTDAQNARTRAVLDNLPGRAKIESRIRELLQITTVSPPTMALDRYFHTRREGNQNQAVLYARDGAEGKSRVLIDPNTLDKEALVTLAWYQPSQDGKLLAFGTYRAGDENAVAHILDVDSGKWHSDKIKGKVDNELYWLPDASGFVYRNLSDVENPYSGQVMFHRLGTEQKQDKLLFEQYKTGPHASTWGPFGQLSKDGRWLLLGYHTSTKSNDLWICDFDQFLRSGKLEKVEIITGADARFNGEFNGDTLFMHTNLDAANGRVIAVDLHHPDKSHWREIVPERKDAVIDSVRLARGILTVVYQKSATTQIRLFDLDGSNARDLELPGIGTAELITEPDRTEAFVNFNSFNTPPTIYRVDLKSRQRKLWDKTSVPVDPDSVEVKQVFYSSTDGARVSMFLVHKKDLKLDGNNPTLLTGYGGFAINITPQFNPVMFNWFESGGVLAFPNLRGGGEYGETWHTNGMLANKQNSYNDFLSAAQWLVDNHYTNPKRLAIIGGSNGGLLVGAAVTQKPELFSAVVCAVPLLDMVRYQNFLMARYWVPEYGTAEDAEQFKFLFKYSPYHNVKSGTKYPAVLFSAGENDTRVHPLHARKMAALMQASTASDPQQKPILLWVDRESGHGRGRPLKIRVRDSTDSQIFLMWQLGTLPAGAQAHE
ncbi:MAG TPA: prolyl oligopeptidase family serine peptidase [Tepidisphaeraceae bacterium]|jgi:prolyl oligopeptidase